MIRRLRFALASALVLMVGITCTDGGLTGPRSSSGRLVNFGLVPAFTKAATEIFQNLEAFGYEVNNVHLQLKHANGQTAKDTIVAIATGQDSVLIQLSVALNGVQEDLGASIELRDDNVVLFSGTQTVTAKVGGTPTPPPPVPVAFTGPGANAVSLTLTPHDTVVVAGQSLTLKPSAKDNAGANITNLALAWSVKDATRGTVDGNGVFTALTGVGRGETYVISRLISGPKDSAHIVVSLPASKVVGISGVATGVVGKPLSQNFVVETQASDNLVVPFTPLTLSVISGGGTLSAANVVTDANGRAQFSFSPGTTAGANVIQISGTGITPLQLTISGTPDKATKLAMVQQPAGAAPSGAVLPTQPSVRVQDQYGNSVAAQNVAVSASLTAADGRILGGTTTVTTNASGIAQFTDLVITGLAGATSLTFSQDTLAAVVSNAVNVTVGAATTLTLEGSSTFTAVAGALMAGAPAFLVTDGGGNGVPNVPLQVSVSDGQGGTSSASINTDANGRFALSSIAAKPTAGTYTFTITNAGLAGSPITVQGNVVNAAAHHVKFLTGPVTAQPAGTAMSIVIEVQDQFNNRTTTGPGATANVTLALSGGTVGAVLGPDAAARTQAAVSGVATFSVNVNLAGTGYVVFASAPELSLPAVASGPFDVSAGAPAVVSSVLGEGAGLIQGDEQVLRALVKDASGNNLVGASVTFTVISGGGTLNSSTAPQTTSTGTDGTASADFRPGTAGIQLVRASAGSASVDFHLFLAETLAVVIEPTQNPQSGLPLTTQPRVALRDLQGNPVRRAGIDLLAEVITDPPLQDVLRPTLSGNVVARTDANGEATWTNLAVVGQIQTVRLAISEAGEFPTIRPVLSQLLGLQAGAGIAVRSLNTSPAFRNVGADVDFTYRTTDGFNAVPNVAVLVSSVSANCPLVSGASQDTVVSDASGSVTVRVHAPDGPASCNIYAILRDLPTLCAPPACDPTQWFVVDRLLIVPNGMWVWVGGQLTSSDWSDTRNWYLDGRNNGTIPSATETAFIPGFFAPVTNTLPVVSGSVDVGSLITEIGGGFVVDAGNTLRINGNVDIQGSVSGTGTVWLSPNGDVRNGTLRAFTLQGTLRIGPTDRTCTETSPYTMVGPVVVGQLDLRCRLEMAKETMSVTGDALVTDGGWLLMSQAGAFLSIQGNATFDGNATLTDGFMQVGKNFSHTGNGDSRAFSASGNHRTQIVGDATGGLAFQWNTPGGFSRFGTLDFLTTKGVVAIKSDQAATLTADQFHVGAASQVAIPANVILGIPALPLGNALTIDKDGILTLEDLRSVAGLACAALKVGDNVGPLSCLVGK